MRPDLSLCPQCIPFGDIHHWDSLEGRVGWRGRGGIVGLGGGLKGGRVEGGPEALGNCKRVKDEMVIILRHSNSENYFKTSNI